MPNDSRANPNSRKSHLVSTCMADIQPRQPTWLWRNRFPLGQISVIAGKQGLGKSFLTCDMASRVSRGEPWPDGAPCEQGSVLMITAEDDPSHTVRPRLDAHVAKANNIHMIEHLIKTNADGSQSELFFTLNYIDALKELISEKGNVRLVIIDPIGSYLGGGIDCYRDNEVRGVLAPLAKMAADWKLAVVLVAHTTKASYLQADDNVLGSRAFTALARAVWHVGTEPGDDQKRLLLPGKNNLAKRPDGLAYTIDGDPGRCVWQNEPVKMSADDLAGRNFGEKRPSRFQEAVQWLGEILPEGEELAYAEIEEAAEQDGISMTTLKAAKKKVGIKSRKDGTDGPWYWRHQELS